MADLELNSIGNGDGNNYLLRDNSKIPLSGSNQISGDLIPSTDGTVNLGSSSYQWNNAYIKSLAIDGDLVGRGNLTLQSNSGTARIFLRNNDVSSFPNSVNLYSKVNDVEYGVFLNGNTFFPTINGEMNFGYSQRRWKDCYTNAINGIAPNELGLPTSTYTDVSSYITNFDSTSNTFTAPVSGLLNVIAGGDTGIACAISDATVGIAVSSRDEFGYARAIIPVVKGDTIRVFLNKQVATEAKIYHLKGKV